MTLLRANIAASRNTRALIEGRVTSDLLRLDFCGPEEAQKGFKPMLRERAFDVGEMAIATFLQAVGYGYPVCLLPVVVSGRFQHDTIAVNDNFGVLTPKDLEGRRVAVRAYTQTTGLWARGILQHEHGVDLSRITFCVTEGGHVAEYDDPPNALRLPEDSDLGQMLVEGRVDAVLMGAASHPRVPGVRSLIPDPKAAAQAWYHRHGCVPINHVIAVDRRLVQDSPDLVRELWRMFRAAKASTGETPDTMPLGFDAIRPAVEIAAQLAHEQGLTPRRITADALFADTIDLIGQE